MSACAGLAQYGRYSSRKFYQSNGRESHTPKTIRTNFPSIDQTSLDKSTHIPHISVMTEITDIKKLPDAVQNFVLHWGDLGGTWGVNRTVAQIHALLYLAEQPLNAEDIQTQLSVARSNVSNSLKELLALKLVRRVPIPGDRRDHFAAETDVWQVARHIAAARKAREIDPALATLTECLATAAGDNQVTDEQIRRLQDMHDFTATMDRWYTKMSSLPSSTLSRLVSMGDAVVKVLNLGRAKE